MIIKKFWTTAKPIFCNKTRSAENVRLDQNDKLVRDEKEVKNIFNDFFVNIVPNLGIATNMISLILKIFIII